MFAVFVTTTSMDVLQKGSTLETIVLWCGEHADMHFICSVFKSGSYPIQSTNVRCAEDLGNSNQQLSEKRTELLSHKRLHNLSRFELLQS